MNAQALEIDRELFEEMYGSQHAPVEYESPAAEDFHRAWRAICRRPWVRYRQGRFILINGGPEGGTASTGRPPEHSEPPAGYTWPEYILALYAALGCQCRNEFVAAIESSRSSVYDWLRGKSTPSYTVAARLKDRGRECGLIEVVA